MADTELFGFAEIARLNDALDDADENVRVAALRALVRLPLRPEVWRKLSERVVGQFANPFLSSPERAAIVEAAVYIPTREARQALHDLAANERDPRRRTAQQALVQARDPVVVPFLLSDLTDPAPERRERAARALSSLDVGALRSEVESIFQSEQYGTTKLFLALALRDSGGGGGKRNTP